MTQNLNLSEQTKNTLALISKILLKSFFIGLIILCVWFFLFITFQDRILNTQALWFGISIQQFHIVIYCAMGLFKLFLFIFYLIPFLAIHCVLRCRCCCKK